MIFAPFFDQMIKSYLYVRNKRLEHIIRDAPGNQEKIRKKLLERGKDTIYGKKFRFSSLSDRSSFTEEVPVTQYEDLYPYIERSMMGEENVLWPGKTVWYAKSSGTTDRSKFIPVTKEFLSGNLVKSSWDSVGFIYNKRRDAALFSEKSLLMGGSLTTFEANKEVKIGDVSAIMLATMPSVGRPFYTPDFDTALLSNWERKIEITAEKCMTENVVMFGGVPTWTIVLFDRILEISGKDNMSEIWPQAHSYMHGGVGFGPYKNKFNNYFPGGNLDFWEVYNASEGYFAISNKTDEAGMLLLVDNDIFYEFIPLDLFKMGNLSCLPLEEVTTGEDYVLVISTSAGLWRYVVGDTIKFLSMSPYKIIVTGRTKQYLNTFGEEVMVHNTEEALTRCCEKHSCKISDYTVGPIYMDDGKGGHEWLVEFETEPEDLNRFREDLDSTLRSLNSDYDAKRFNNLALKCLELNILPQGSFYRWMMKKNKLGGQNKVPRLNNDRRYIDEIKEVL